MKATVPSFGFRVPGWRTGRESGVESELGTRNPEPRASRAGFTLIEIMVAIAVSAALFGLCIAIYVRVSRYKSRSEELLFVHENARGILDRMKRDLGGLYVADNDSDGTAQLINYWRLEKAPVAGCSGDRLTFLSAAENPGKLDHCTVQYYVENNKLYRELSSAMGGSPPGGGWPAKDASVLAEDVEKLLVTTTPATPPAETLPSKVTITLQLTDEPGTPPYKVFTVELRPGAEEN